MGCGCNKSKVGYVNYPKKKMIFKWTPKKSKFEYQMNGQINLRGNFDINKTK
jgi:hypothetical protein